MKELTKKEFYGQVSELNQDDWQTIKAFYLCESDELVEAMNANVEDGVFNNLKDVQSFADYNIKSDKNENVVIIGNNTEAYIIKK